MSGVTRDRQRARGQRVSGTLFLVAVPIGNPDDLTLRARTTLASVAVVAAEDTRHFATLARHHGIATRTVSYHDHNEDARTRELHRRDSWRATTWRSSATPARRS